MPRPPVKPLTPPRTPLTLSQPRKMRPGGRLVRRKEFASRWGVCLRKLDGDVAKGLIPPPLPTGGRSVGWFDYEVDEILQQLVDVSIAAQPQPAPRPLSLPEKLEAVSLRDPGFAARVLVDVTMHPTGTPPDRVLADAVEAAYRELQPTLGSQPSG